SGVGHSPFVIKVYGSRVKSGIFPNFANTSRAMQMPIVPLSSSACSSARSQRARLPLAVVAAVIVLCVLAPSCGRGGVGAPEAGPLPATPDAGAIESDAVDAGADDVPGALSGRWVALADARPREGATWATL